MTLTQERAPFVQSKTLYGRYRVYPDGKIVSTWAIIKERKHPLVLVGATNSDGYNMICLTLPDNSTQVVSRHRIVAELFVPRTNSRYNFVRFKDGNRSNCHASNLEWSQCPHDQQRGRKRGEMTSPRFIYVVQDGYRIKGMYKSIKAIADELRLSTPSIVLMANDGHVMIRGRNKGMSIAKYERGTEDYELMCELLHLHQEERHSEDMQTVQPNHAHGVLV